MLTLLIFFIVHQKIYYWIQLLCIFLYIYLNVYISRMLIFKAVYMDLKNNITFWISV